ncbi:MAG: hypothetical protein R3B90_23345 [Planctomycetaceae bacterium]
MRCHAVSKGGGQIGPDLSPVGVSSPVDYLVKSLYDPDAQKKEEYVTRIIITDEGQQVTGVIADRTEDKLTLKTADGKRVEIAVSDIDIEAEGRSLMPDGLVKFMTEQEVLDLVKFLSQLGKPDTAYGIRTTQRMQRWRLLKQSPDSFQTAVPDDELFGDVGVNGGVWEPAYGRVGGALPLGELTQRTGQPVVYVMGEFDVTAAGSMNVVLDDVTGVSLWLDGNSYPTDGDLLFDLEPGRHSVALRVDTAARAALTIELELRRPAGSKAQFTVVDGQ